MSATAEASQRRGKRPWLAVVLAVLHPGLGHLYLREWLRAVLWFGTILLASSLFVPPGVADEIWQALVAGDFAAVSEAGRAIPLESTIAILGLTLLNVVDAYWLAKQTRQQQPTGGATTECPHCGKELDEDLDFCHWCTTQLDAPEEPVD